MIIGINDSKGVRAIMKFIYRIPKKLRNSFFVYCPIHTDVPLTRMHKLPQASNTNHTSGGICEACFKAIFNMKRGIQDGCTTQTERLRKYYERRE